MGSDQNHLIMPCQDQEMSTIFRFGYAPVVHAVFTTAVELNLFDIIAKAGPDAYLSPAETASQLPTQNHEAPLILGRILQLLASHSILNCSLVYDKDGQTATSCGLNSLSKYLVPDEHGISQASAVLWVNAIKESCYSLKEAILEGGIPFERAKGMQIFQYMGINKGLNEVFNQAMRVKTTVLMREILQVYKGFKGIESVVDVGGGLGAVLNAIVTKCPGIRGINFDLPHVIKNAPRHPGVEYVEGDMFHSVLEGDAIILKHILHDWTDEACLKLLKNCWKALPDSGGKLIVIEMILPDSPETDSLSRNAFTLDILMLSLTPGGKERTHKEFANLARAAGFEDSKLVCFAHQYGVLEFYKNYRSFLLEMQLKDQK